MSAGDALMAHVESIKEEDVAMEEEDQGDEMDIS